MSKATQTKPVRQPAPLAGLEVFNDANGAYAPAICNAVSSGLTALQASVQVIADLKRNGKLSEKVQKIAENSIILGAVMSGLQKRGFKGPLLPEALRLRALKGWRQDCKGTDEYRTQGEEQLFTAARVAKKYYLDRLGLTTVSTQGGKRANAGKKRASESKSEAAKVTKPEAAKAAEQTLIKKQDATSFKAATPIKKINGVVEYFQMLDKGIAMTAAQNTEMFKDELVRDVCKNIHEQIERLLNKFSL